MKTTNLESDGIHAGAITRGSRRPKRASSDLLIRDLFGTEVLANEVVLAEGLSLADDDDGTAIISASDPALGPDPGPTVNAPITADLSNPPTQAELEDAIGSAASLVAGQSYVVIDSDTGLAYDVKSTGAAFTFEPSVSPASDLVTLATAAGIFSDFAAMWGAAQYDATSDTTFWAYTNAAGDICVRSWDHATQTASAVTILKAALGAGDSHVQPALLIRSSDRKVLVFYCAHNGAAMYLRISSAAADISAFAAEVDLDPSIGGTAYTYPIAYELSDGIYLFARTTTTGAGQVWSYTKSTDNGATWATKVTFAQEAAAFMYVMPSQTSDVRVDFLASDDAPFGGGPASLYHCFLRNGAFYTTNGTVIASLPMDTSDMTTVWTTDGVQAANPGQVILGPDGHPRALFRVIDDTSPEVIRYLWNRHDATGWGTAVEIAAAGSASQTATCVFADGDPYTVYYSQDVGGVAQIFRATTIDEGVTWTASALTDTALENALLVTVRDAAPELPVLWNALSGGWTRDDTVAAAFLGAGFVPVEGADAQRLVVIDDTDRAEAILKRTASGVWQASRDLGTSWESIGSALTIVQGLAPVGTPLGFSPSAAMNTANVALPAVSGGNGGAIAIPIYLSAAMKFHSIEIWNASTASARAAEARVYRDNGTATADFVVGTDASFSFTPSAQDARASTVSGAPVDLTPGYYWLVFRNTSASQTFQIGRTAGGNVVPRVSAWRVKSIAALGSTLDLSTSWTGLGSYNVSPGTYLLGRVLGESAPV